jgi:hypothetical protein
MVASRRDAWSRALEANVAPSMVASTRWLVFRTHSIANRLRAEIHMGNHKPQLLVLRVHWELELHGALGYALEGNMHGKSQKSQKSRNWLTRNWNGKMPTDAMDRVGQIVENLTRANQDGVELFALEKRTRGGAYYYEFRATVVGTTVFADVMANIAKASAEAAAKAAAKAAHEEAALAKVEAFDAPNDVSDDVSVFDNVSDASVDVNLRKHLRTSSNATVHDHTPTTSTMSSSSSSTNETDAEAKPTSNLAPVVFVESPYSANAKTGASIDRHVRYLNLVGAEMSMVRGECPVASHASMTQHARAARYFVTDYDSKWDVLTRDQAISLAQSMRVRCDKTVFYTDLGWSRGMLAGRAFCKEHDVAYEERSLRVDELAAAVPGYSRDFIRAILDPKKAYDEFMMD